MNLLKTKLHLELESASIINELFEKYNDMNLSQEVGKRIRKYRLSKGLTQEELAFQTGLHQAQIYRLETGRRRFYSDQLEKISEVLGVPVINFFPKEIKNDQDINDQDLVEIVSRIPAEQRKDLAEFLLNLEGKNINFKTLKEDLKIMNILRSHFSS